MFCRADSGAVKRSPWWQAWAVRHTQEQTRLKCVLCVRGKFTQILKRQDGRFGNGSWGDAKAPSKPREEDKVEGMSLRSCAGVRQ